MERLKRGAMGLFGSECEFKVVGGSAKAVSL